MACSFCKGADHDVRKCPAKLRQRQGGRRGGQAAGSKRTAAQTKARRKNGRKGGRPVEHSYFAIFAELPEPPDDTLERNTWAQRIASICLRETLQGRGSTRLNDEVRRLCKTIADLTPKERLYRAEATIMSDANALKKKPRSAGARTQPALPSKGPMR